MKRYAIFVDAGYLLAAGGWATVDVNRRAQMVVDYAGLINLILERSSDLMGSKELLRLYWFDASPNRVPMKEHLTISEVPDTKVRMGQLTLRGEQKGVDAMLFADLTSLSHEGRIGDAIVVAGDGDFVEAVSRSQSAGVRVHVWGVHTPQSTVSPDLRREADRFFLLSPDELRAFFERVPEPEEATPSSIDTTIPATTPVSANTATSHESEQQPMWASVDLEDVAASGARFARQWARLATAGELARLLSLRPDVPGDIHYRLLRFTLEEAGIAWGTRISYDATEAMRNGFWNALVDVAQK